MGLVLDVQLSARQREELARIPADAWFTSARFRNATTPLHPQHIVLDRNHEMKRRLVLDWLKNAVAGKRVLDLFCANGAFSVEASLAGATEVVGMDCEERRIDCARFLAGTIEGTGCCIPTFLTGDVYRLADSFHEPFDVVLCLGGLYHIADPPHVLTQIRTLTREALIVQTANILPFWGSFGRFVVRRDRTHEGLASIVGGRGVWCLTATCFENVLRHAGFRISSSRRPPLIKRRRFPWYAALSRPI